MPQTPTPTPTVAPPPIPASTIRWEPNPHAGGGVGTPVAAAAAAAPSRAQGAGPAGDGIQWEPNPAAAAGTTPATRREVGTGGSKMGLDQIVPFGSELLGAGLAGAAAAPFTAGMSLPAALVTAATAAGVGGMVGRTAGNVSRPSGAPPLPETVRQAGEAFTTNAMGEGIGAPIVAGAARAVRHLPVRAFGAYLRRNMSPEAREAASFVGGKVTPGQISDSPFIQFMDNIAGATFGRGRYRQVFEDAENQFVRQAESEIAGYGPKATPSQAGTALREGMVREAEQRGAAEVNIAARRGAELRGTEQAGVDAAQAQISQAEQALARLSERFGPAAPVEDVGRGSQGLIEAAYEAADKAQSAIYNDLWRRTKVQGVDITPLATRAEQLAQESGTVGRATGVQGRASRSVGALVEPPPVPGSASSPHDEAAATIPGYQSALQSLQTMNPADPRRLRLEQELTSMRNTFGIAATGEDTLPTPQQVHRLRSFYGRMARATKGPEHGLFTQLQQAADAVLEQGLSPADLKQYRQASSLHKQMVEKFEEGALAQVMEAHPADAVKALIGRQGAVTDVQLARETLGEGWKPVQARVWADLTHHPNGALKSEGELLRDLRGWSPEELTAVFGPDAEDVATVGRQTLPQAINARGVVDAGVGAEADKVMAAAITNAATGVSKAQALKVYPLVQRTLSKASPEDIVKLKALTGEDGWKQVQSLELQRILGREGDDAVGVASPGALIKKLTARGERLPAIFDQNTVNFLHQFARVRTQLAKSGVMGSSGKMWLQLATPSAVGGVVGAVAGGEGNRTEGALKGAGAILLTPYLLARIATSPTLQRTLVGAMTASGRAEAGTASRLVSQLVSQLVREGVMTGGPAPAQAQGAGPGGAGPAANRPPVPSGRGAGSGPLGAPPQPFAAR